MAPENPKSVHNNIRILEPRTRTSDKTITEIANNLREHLLTHQADDKDLQSVLSGRGWMLGGPLDDDDATDNNDTDIKDVESENAGKDKKEWLCDLCGEMNPGQKAVCATKPECKGISVDWFTEHLIKTKFYLPQLKGDDGQRALDEASGEGVEHNILIVDPKIRPNRK